MKKVIKSKIILLSLTWLSFQTTGTAQESLNASGGDITTSSGSVSYSIGQLFYNTYSNDYASVQQGVQQAFEIYTLGTEELAQSISMRVYPNPTTNSLSLKIEDYQQEKMNYQIYDLNGRKVGQGKVTSKETDINMSDFASATYLIYVLDQDNKTNQKFKIIKK